MLRRSNSQNDVICMLDCFVDFSDMGFGSILIHAHVYNELADLSCFCFYNLARSR